MDDCEDKEESLVSLSNLKPVSLEEHGHVEGKIEGEGENKKERDDGEENGGGGLISSIVSNLGATFPSLSPSGEHKDEGGGGLINHLISSLPASTTLISDEQYPAADEASLLISIVED